MYGKASFQALRKRVLNATGNVTQGRLQLRISSTIRESQHHVTKSLTRLDLRWRAQGRASGRDVCLVQSRIPRGPETSPTGKQPAPGGNAVPLASINPF